MISRLTMFRGATARAILGGCIKELGFRLLREDLCASVKRTCRRRGKSRITDLCMIGEIDAVDVPVHRVDSGRLMRASQRVRGRALVGLVGSS